jgi:hypothetical protein
MVRYIVSIDFTLEIQFKCIICGISKFKLHEFKFYCVKFSSNLMNIARNIQFLLHNTQILALIIFILQATSKNSIYEKYNLALFTKIP